MALIGYGRGLQGKESLEASARLAQSAERKALNLVVVGSSPTVGVFIFGSWASSPRAKLFKTTTKVHLARIELATFSVLG